MDINILLIIVLITLAAGIVLGWKRGLLESVIRIISCVLGILVLVIVAKGIGSFIQKSYVRVIMALILLFAIRIIHRIVKFMFDTFKLVREIPIGKFVDKLAGTLLGFAEAVFVVWLMFIIIGIFDNVGLNKWIISQVNNSQLLTAMYYSNYLIELLRKILI